MSASHKICLILPYFGTFPSWFSLWLESAAKNSFIDFLILTDTPNAEIPVSGESMTPCVLGEYPSGNIHVRHMLFNETQRRAESVLGFKCKLGFPYKLCDYKPLYGLMFADMLEGYDFWGYCDPDIVWGNLSHYITEERLNNYDKIYGLGHLTLYRNTEEINRHVLTFLSPSIINYWEAYHLPATSHFDEFPGTWRLDRYLARKSKLRILHNRTDFADITPKYIRLCSAWMEHGDSPQIYEYNDGSLYGWFSIEGKLTKKEMAYIHLQKREMSIKILDSKHFIIAACSFLPYRPITLELLEQFGNDLRPMPNITIASSTKRRNLSWMFYKSLQYTRYLICRYLLRMR